jgi:hypothetical protein
MMGDYVRDGLDLDDDDRLPWLEPADDDGADEGISTLKLLTFIVAGLALVGAVVFGIWYVKNKQSLSGGGDGTLIAAPKGDYKVAANEADAKAFQGEGDASFPVSEGEDRDSRIDPSRLPEVPVTGGAAPVNSAKTGSKPSAKFSAPVVNATNAGGKAAAPSSAPASGAAMIQLGAYGSEAVAKDAWSRLSKRFAYLAPLGTSIEKATVGSGTFYRLRANAPSVAEANTLCGKLKVAGESCIVVR